MGSPIHVPMRGMWLFPLLSVLSNTRHCWMHPCSLSDGYRVVSNTSQHLPLLDAPMFSMWWLWYNTSSFDLYFSYYKWGWASFPVLLDTGVYSCPLHSLCPSFFCWVVFFLLMYKSTLNSHWSFATYIEWKISLTLCKKTSKRSLKKALCFLLFVMQKFYFEYYFLNVCSMLSTNVSYVLLYWLQC